MTALESMFFSLTGMPASTSPSEDPATDNEVVR
jgi:hypothetical protein